MTKIRFVDQNNNVYTIEKKWVDYQPIKPEQSSSGTYSGGHEAKVIITEKIFEELSELANEIAANKKGHTTKRQMLTAMIYLTIDEQTYKYILSNSAERRRFEKRLKEIIL